MDANRVILNNSGGSTDCDYIHANFIGSPISKKRIIATQAPMEWTAEDFYRMILQENCEIILMLCRCFETGLEKSYQYWPLKLGESVKYGNIFITHMKSGPMSPDNADVVETELKMTYKVANNLSETRIIKHLQYKEWKDGHVPAKYSEIMKMALSARMSTKPVVVHCSAGIGRTGVMCAIMILLDKISSRAELRLDNLICEIRNQRAQAIQNKLQYLYIYRSLLFFFVEELKMFDDIEDIQAKYKKFAIDYQHMLNSNDEE